MQSKIYKTNIHNIFFLFLSDITHSVSWDCLSILLSSKLNYSLLFVTSVGIVYFANSISDYAWGYHHEEVRIFSYTISNLSSVAVTVPLKKYSHHRDQSCHGHSARLCKLRQCCHWHPCAQCSHSDLCFKPVICHYLYHKSSSFPFSQGL